MAAIDLYSGIGGWTLGFKMAGIPVLSSYEWWKDANDTHNKNFGTANKEIDIRKLKLDSLPSPSEIDFVVGSPPCTQFSFANRGGNGDIADGLIDIYKFLEVVDYLKPKYWAMENVPRVASILEKEIQEGGSLNKFKALFTDIRVYDSSNFGIPQKRKRMIAGRLPFDLLDSYQAVTPKLTLGDVLEALNKDNIVDPIYGTKLTKQELTDHIKEAPLSEEETRLNSNAKSYHPVYNVMSFPDKWDRPSRTITALCTRVSRESIVIRDHHGNLRRLTVRERGCVQSFPINFQFHSNSYGGKLKMIGNAIPPILTFYIAQSMLERKVKDLILPNQAINPVVVPDEFPIIHEPDNKGANYPWSRSFWMAIPGLRFGSGVRFELRNKLNKVDKSIEWNINFYFGNSKNIKQKKLDNYLFDSIINDLKLIYFSGFYELFEDLEEFIKSIDIIGLQKNWTNIDRSKDSPIDLIEGLAKYSVRLENFLRENSNIQHDKLSNVIMNVLKNGEGKIDNKKLLDEPFKIITGMLIGSYFNETLKGSKIQLELPLAV